MLPVLKRETTAMSPHSKSAVVMHDHRWRSGRVPRCVAAGAVLVVVAMVAACGDDGGGPAERRQAQRERIEQAQRQLDLLAPHWEAAFDCIEAGRRRGCPALDSEQSALVAARARLDPVARGSDSAACDELVDAVQKTLLSYFERINAWRASESVTDFAVSRGELATLRARFSELEAVCVE